MKATLEEPKFEILPPDVATASTELSCPADKVAALYAPFEKPFQAAADLLAEEEKAITAFDARALRLKMVKARTTITATKDESKSDIKLAGNIIDWFHNKGRDRLASAEARLLEIEKAEERAEAARIDAIAEERIETLRSMDHVSHGFNFGTMSEEHWKEYLQQAKDAYEMKQIRIKREAEEAAAELAKQEAEREARRLEQIRVKEEQDKALAEARAEAEAARKEREAQAAAAEAERKAAAAERDARRQEFLAAEKAAELARQKANAELLKEREAKAKLEAEAKTLRDAEAKRIADQKAAEVAKAKAEALAAKKAAAAPDRTRIIGFAGELAAMRVPAMKTPEGERMAEDIDSRIIALANWIQEQAANL